MKDYICFIKVINWENELDITDFQYCFKNIYTDYQYGFLNVYFRKYINNNIKRKIINKYIDGAILRNIFYSFEDYKSLLESYITYYDISSLKNGRYMIELYQK